MVEPYVTVAEADVYLANSTIWQASTTEEKDTALFWGRLYLDSNYSCIYFDSDSPPDEIKYANSLLGEDYLDGTLIKTGSESSGKVKLKRSKAGGVESEKEFFQPGETLSSYRDDVDTLLYGICSKKSSNRAILRT